MEDAWFRSMLESPVLRDDDVATERGLDAPPAKRHCPIRLGGAPASSPCRRSPLHPRKSLRNLDLAATTLSCCAVPAETFSPVSIFAGAPQFSPRAVSPLSVGRAALGASTSPSTTARGAASPLSLGRAALGTWGLIAGLSDCGDARGEAEAAAEETAEEDTCWRRRRLPKRKGRAAAVDSVVRSAPGFPSTRSTSRAVASVDRLLLQYEVACGPPRAGQEQQKTGARAASLIGKGAYGEVFRGRCRATGEKVAVKFIKGHDDTSVARELEFARRLNHCSVVKFLDSCAYHAGGQDTEAGAAEAGRLSGVVVMECAQYALDDPERCAAASAADVKRWMRQLLSALDYLHRVEHAVHRDIKPANLLVDEDGDLKLCDFSISRRLPSTPASQGPLAAPSTAAVFPPGAEPPPSQDVAAAAAATSTLTAGMSTPAYAAPEVLLAMPYGTAADMWAAGLVMGELLSGAPLMPQSFGTEEQLQNAVALLGPPSAAQSAAAKRAGFELHVQHESAGDLRVRPRLPPDAVGLLRGLLQLDPNKRLTAAVALRHPYLA